MSGVGNPTREMVGGVPLVSVIGTPRTMGEHLGTRLKSRLQVLTGYLSDQLCSHARPAGHRLTPEKLRETVRPALPMLQRHEPSLWMELEAMGHASELPIEDLLLVQGYGDLLSYLGCQVPPQPSTYICVDSTHTQTGTPLLALVWYLDPALFPYLTLMRRIPTHGPATLSLTLAGLGPVAGLSEAGVAVAANEFRVKDGSSGLFTGHVLASMLSTPGLEDALRYAQAGPRHGGAAIHGLAASGDRFTFEVSGQIAARLNDPLLNAPRVHTNHPLDERIMPAVDQIDPTSKMRLEQVASQVVALGGITPSQIAGWFSLGTSSPHPASRVGNDTDRIPTSSVLIVLDPGAKELHLMRSGVPGPLETISL